MGKIEIQNKYDLKKLQNISKTQQIKMFCYVIQAYLLLHIQN